MCFGLVLVYNRCSAPPDIEKVDTVTVIEFDTITLLKDTTIYKPQPKIVEIIKRDTVTKDTVLTTEKKTYITECTNENDTAIITATITGVSATLDSLQVDWRKHTIVQTKTEYITKYITKPRKLKDHFKFNVGVGYGYGLNNKQFEPFVGVSFGYNF